MNQYAMHPVCIVDEIAKCMIVQFNNGSNFFVDHSDYNLHAVEGFKIFKFSLPTDTYPSYYKNYTQVSLIEEIYGFKRSNVSYLFRNSNALDLRRANVDVVHNSDLFVRANYNVLQYNVGHRSTMGADAFIMKNPTWHVATEQGGYDIIMFCEKNTFCRLCPASYKVITDYEKMHLGGKKITFYFNAAGYIMGSNSLLMHQIIMDLHGNGRGTMTISVDHIDQNPLNNTLANLRIATRHEQEQNSNGTKPDTKRQRMSNARALPDGIKQTDLRKNVVYYSEVYNKEKGLTREFFKVEGHPRLDKSWCSSKSGQVDVHAKLASANLVVDDLARGIFPEAPDTGLPNHVSLSTVVSTVVNKSHLVYDRRVQPDVRHTLKMVMPMAYVLQEQVVKLNQKVVAKYGAEFNLLGG